MEGEGKGNAMEWKCKTWDCEGNFCCFICICIRFVLEVEIQVEGYF